MSSVLLIGTGNMAVDYAKVLTAMNQNFVVVGRGTASAQEFTKKTNITPITGGIENFLKINTPDSNTKAIVATGTESLMGCLRTLVKAGIHNILVEKPGAISIAELLEHEEELLPCSETIFLAYNRRFYASVIETIKMIEADGGLLSMSFEFTEWAHKIDPLVKAPGVKENWFFANSTHVVDLAFHFAGMPAAWKCFSKTGKIAWHEKTNFCGAGVTEEGVLFSYLSNWESSGRWGIELLTRNRRIFLRPLEEIMVQKKGSVVVEKYEFDDVLDKNFKPGLYNQALNFLAGGGGSACSLHLHFKNTKHIFKRMLE